MMDRDTNSSRGEAMPDEPSPAKRRGHLFGAGLVMPQEDDPAGDGHMWSGRAAGPKEQSPDDPGDVEVGGPSHIPTVHEGPRPF